MAEYSPLAQSSTFWKKTSVVKNILYLGFSSANNPISPNFKTFNQRIWWTIVHRSNTKEKIDFDVVRILGKGLQIHALSPQKMIRVQYLRNKALNKLVQPISNWLATHTGLEPTKLLHVPAVQGVDLLPSQQSVLVRGEVRHHIPARRHQGCRSRATHLQAHVPVNGCP